MNRPAPLELGRRRRCRFSSRHRWHRSRLSRRGPAPSLPVEYDQPDRTALATTPKSKLACAKSGPADHNPPIVMVPWAA